MYQGMRKITHRALESSPAVQVPEIHFRGVAGCHVYVHSNYIVSARSSNSDGANAERYNQACIMPDLTLLSLNRKYKDYNVNNNEMYKIMANDPLLLQLFHEHSYTVDALQSENDVLPINFTTDTLGIEKFDVSTHTINTAMIIGKQVSDNGGRVRFLNNGHRTKDPHLQLAENASELERLHNESLYFQFILPLDKPYDLFMTRLKRYATSSSLPINNSIAINVIKKFPSILESVLPNKGEFNTRKIMAFDVIGYHDGSNNSLSYNVESSRLYWFIQMMLQYDKDYLRSNFMNFQTCVQNIPIKYENRTFTGLKTFDDNKEARNFFSNGVMTFVSSNSIRWIREDSSHKRFTKRQDYFDDLISRNDPRMNESFESAKEATLYYSRMPLSIATELSPFVFPDFTTSFSIPSISRKIGNGSFGVVYAAQYSFECGVKSLGNEGDINQGTFVESVSKNNNHIFAHPDLRNFVLMNDADVIYKYYSSLLINVGNDKSLIDINYAKRNRNMPVESFSFTINNILRTKFYQMYEDLNIDSLSIDIPANIFSSPLWGGSNKLSAQLQVSVAKYMVKFAHQLKTCLFNAEYSRQTNTNSHSINIQKEFGRKMLPLLREGMALMTMTCQPHKVASIQNKVDCLDYCINEMETDIELNVTAKGKCDIVIKTAKSISLGLTEAGIQQYLTCFRFMPPTMDNFFGNLTSPITNGTTRNLLNKLHMESFARPEANADGSSLTRYNFPICPRDDSLGTVARIIFTSIEDGSFMQELTITDGNNTVISQYEIEMNFPFTGSADADANNNNAQYLQSLLSTAINPTVNDDSWSFYMNLLPNNHENICPVYNAMIDTATRVDPMNSNDLERSHRTLTMSPIMSRGDYKSYMRQCSISNATINGLITMKQNMVSRDRSELEEKLLKTPSLPMIVNNWIQILGSVATMNNEGLCHSDFKAANVLVDHNGDCFIGDFGGATWYGQKRAAFTLDYMQKIDTWQPDAIYRYFAIDSLSDQISVGRTIKSVLFQISSAQLENDLPPIAHRYNTFVINTNVAHMFNCKISRAHWNYLSNADPRFSKSKTSQFYCTTNEAIARVQNMPLSIELTEFIIDTFAQIANYLSFYTPDEVDMVPALLSSKYHIGKVNLSPAWFGIPTEEVKSLWANDGYDKINWNLLSGDDKARYGYISKLKICETQLAIVKLMIRAEQIKTLEEAKRNQLYQHYEQY